MNDNKKLFCTLWNKNKDEPMLFISSNSGTGKTTFFKWLFIRRAFEHGENLDIFYRWADDIPLKFTNQDFLTPPPTASKRLLKLANSVEIIQENRKYYLIKKETKEKIGQAFAINIQEKSKSNENNIISQRAFFDEVLSESMRYCPEECHNFARLIDTRKRYRKYQVVCTYNNTVPFFPYRDYWGDSGAKFIDFVGKKYQPKGFEKGVKDLGDILSKSPYGEVYNNNNFKYYFEFYKECNSKNYQTIFYVQIQDKLLKLKDCEDFYILENARKVKKNKDVYSFNLANNDFILANSRINSVLHSLFANRLLFTNDKNNTIYLKTLAENLSLCYNI